MKNRNVHFSRRLKAFSREDGGITHFSLMIFLMILFICGMAVDFMRYETRRTSVQNALDGAVLAATNLSFNGDCEGLIRDFAEKNGLDRSRVSTDCQTEFVSDGGSGTSSDILSRTTSANYDLNVDTIFMGLLGFEDLTGAVASAATQSQNAIEISLVLDISGSMRYDADGNVINAADADNRINGLKGAVEGFLQRILDVDCTGSTCIQPSSSDNISVNIIPYAGQVNPGPELFSLMGGQTWHTWSHCKEVTDSDFDNADLPSDSSWQTPHFMNWEIASFWMNWGWCPQDDAAIMVMENDYNTLNGYVQNIRMHDGTATHIGMKYGVALLNPSTRDEIAELINRGAVSNKFSNRPSNWDEEDVTKIVVLMTDGNTTDQFRPDYTDAAGVSQDWDYEIIDTARPVRSRLQEMIESGKSVEDAVAELSADELAAWEAVTPILDQYGSTNSEFEANEAADLQSFYPDTSKFFENSFTHSQNNNNAHITAMCNQAKQQVLDPVGNVVKEDRMLVYTIAFLAPTSAQDLMRDCATAANYFYNVEDLDISEAFDSIAASINKLTLSQ